MGTKSSPLLKRKEKHKTVSVFKKAFLQRIYIMLQVLHLHFRAVGIFKSRGRATMMSGRFNVQITAVKADPGGRLMLGKCIFDQHINTLEAF